MPIEIERKFRVAGNAWRQDAVGVPITQGYLTSDGEVTVRVRITDESATLTIKGPTVGISRSEFEYPIPMADAEALLRDHCDGRLVHKTRYEVPFAGRTWEVDEFHEENAGLVVAEVELDRPGAPVETPAWVGAEVSGDRRYSNSSLALHPWRDWQE